MVLLARKEKNMACEYKCPKVKFDKEKVKKIYVFLKNGDFFEIWETEIVDVSLHLYDRLVWGNRESAIVAESGFIRLRIEEKKRNHHACFLYNAKELRRDRKAYIENRLIAEGGIDRVLLFDENSWHHVLFGDAFAAMEGEELVIRYRPNELYGPSSEEEHSIMLNTVSKSVVDKIDLSFENCESFEIYRDEIVDMQLDLDKTLCWNSSGYGRRVRSGYIKLRLDREIDWRHVNLMGEGWGKRTKGIRPLERRLCYKGTDVIDICHLYVTYDYAGYGISREECIDIDDIRPPSYFDTGKNCDECELDDCEGCEEAERYWDFISGYAQKQRDGTILIVFGKELPQK